MTQYFYHQENEQKGPVGFEELRDLVSSKVINTNTLVWKAGLEDWVKISELDEFTPLFLVPPPIKNAPPPIKKSTAQDQQQSISPKPTSDKPKKKRRFFLFF